MTRKSPDMFIHCASFTKGKSPVLKERLPFYRELMTFAACARKRREAARLLVETRIAASANLDAAEFSTLLDDLVAGAYEVGFVHAELLLEHYQ